MYQRIELNTMSGAEATGLKSLLETIKKELSFINQDCPFFIAAGSVYSTLFKNAHFNDIDVYFYNEEDYISVAKHYNDPNKMVLLQQTQNALTLPRPVSSPDIQFIKIHFGEPETVLEQFDLINSSCAVTSDGILVRHSGINNNIAVRTEMINAGTIDRYLKYTEEKGCADPQSKVLETLLNYFCDRAFDMFEHGYDIDEPLSGIEVINHAWYVFAETHGQYVHDRIYDRYDAPVAIRLFEKLTQASYHVIPTPCLEFLLTDHFNQKKRIGKLNQYVRTNSMAHANFEYVLNKYPEYFI